MKKKTYVFFMLMFILTLSFPVSAVSEGDDLFGCDCKTWINFEESYVSKLVNDMVSKGLQVDNSQLRELKFDAKEAKQYYLIGMINAYTESYIYLISKKGGDKKKYEDLRFPYRVGQYQIEIDVFCKKPENQTKKVSEVFLIINRLLKNQ